MDPGASINEWHETAVTCEDRHGGGTGDSTLTCNELRRHVVEGQHLNMHLMAHTQMAASRDCACTHACKWHTEVSKHTATYKHSPCESLLPVYRRINHQLLFMCKVDLSSPKGDLYFFPTSHSVWLSYPDHAPIQTPVTIQFNPQFCLLQCILLVNCCVCGKWGCFRDLRILYTKRWKHSTVLGCCIPAEFVAVFRSE